MANKNAKKRAALNKASSKNIPVKKEEIEVKQDVQEQNDQVAQSVDNDQVENTVVVDDKKAKNNKKGDKEEIKALMADFNGRRRDKQPLNYPSAGSTFKRPYGHFAGKLIEDCGLKGYTVGGAMVSDKHAGFVVNKGGATTEDILNVIEHCQKEVFDKFGIKLETEVKIIGEF